MAVCSKSCDGCDYLNRNSSGKHGIRRTCDYILITGTRRGCPAGAECTRRSVGGVAVKGITTDIREDVRAEKTRKPGSGCTSEAAKKVWEKKRGDPAYQIAQIKKWSALSDERLMQVIWGARYWRKKQGAAHGAET